MALLSAITSSLLSNDAVLCLSCKNNSFKCRCNLELKVIPKKFTIGNHH